MSDFRAIQESYVTSIDEAIKVDTDQYKYSHGKNPKGEGNWAFDIGGETVFISGKYSDVVKDAKKQATKKKLFRIQVLP